MMTGICKTIGILMKEVIIESMIFSVKEKKIRILKKRWS